MTELRHDEVGLLGVRRILKEWIAEASESLRKKKVTDANIHTARKQLKKSRAALRLLRNAIGEVVYRRENAALRDAARPLGAARDSRVQMAALDDLVGRYAPATRSLQLEKFRRVLRKNQTAARRTITAVLVEKQRKALREVVARSDRWRMGGGDWRIIGAGLDRVYRSGRKNMSAAARTRASDDLHDWRKQVKYLWHQLQILEPLRPDWLSELADHAHQLADRLGDDHDLAVLRQAIADHPAAFSVNDGDALIAAIDRRRKQLQARAFKLGAHLYQQKPGRFVARIGEHWRSWRAQ